MCSNKYMKSASVKKQSNINSAHATKLLLIAAETKITT